MSDNLTRRGPADRSRVNVSEPWEVSWWCNELACTASELLEAVHVAGGIAEDVRYYLLRMRARG